MSHPCEAKGCTRETKPDQLMCGRHWAMVPSGLAAKVYATWNQRLKSGNPTLHEAAKLAAIKAVAAKEAVLGTPTTPHPTPPAEPPTPVVEETSQFAPWREIERETGYRAALLSRLAKAHAKASGS